MENLQVFHALLLHWRSKGTSKCKVSKRDGVANRTSQTQGGVTTSCTLDNDDELAATSGGFSNSYGYNANGEQTSRTLSGTSYTLSYDYEGQMTSIGGASFACDAVYGRGVVFLLRT
jgi:YD repeat-containing protein